MFTTPPSPPCCRMDSTHWCTGLCTIVVSGNSCPPQSGALRVHLLLCVSAHDRGGALPLDLSGGKCSEPKCRDGNCSARKQEQCPCGLVYSPWLHMEGTTPLGAMAKGINGVGPRRLCCDLYLLSAAEAVSLIGTSFRVFSTM